MGLKAPSVMVSPVCVAGIVETFATFTLHCILRANSIRECPLHIYTDYLDIDLSFNPHPLGLFHSTPI